jgi:hypothetical protein
MEKIKHFIESDKGKDFLVVFIVILVGIFSFELGRVSKAGKSEGLKIEYIEPSQTVIGNQEASVLKGLELAPKAPKSPVDSGKAAGQSYFASSRGSKYYSVGCSAGKTIKQENRVYFATAQEAETAGYILSSSCN